MSMGQWLHERLSSPGPVRWESQNEQWPLRPPWWVSGNLSPSPAPRMAPGHGRCSTCVYQLTLANQKMSGGGGGGNFSCGLFSLISVSTLCRSTLPATGPCVYFPNQSPRNTRSRRQSGVFHKDKRGSPKYSVFPLENLEAIESYQDSSLNFF